MPFTANVHGTQIDNFDHPRWTGPKAAWDHKKIIQFSMRANIKTRDIMIFSHSQKFLRNNEISLSALNNGMKITFQRDMFNENFKISRVSNFTIISIFLFSLKCWLTKEEKFSPR